MHRDLYCHNPHQQEPLPPTDAPAKEEPISSVAVGPLPAEPEPNLIEALQEAASAGVDVNNLAPSDIPAVMATVRSLRSLKQSTEKKIASAPVSAAGSVRSHRT